MRLIGAGLPRTANTTQVLALEHLGFGTSTAPLPAAATERWRESVKASSWSMRDWVA